MYEEIVSAVQNVLKGLGVEAPFTVERPSFEYGDFATNAALVAAKTLKKSPKEVANILVEQLKAEHLPSVASMSVAGVGFINFTLTREALLTTVTSATSELWGTNTRYQGKSVMVEYTDANPFKEFHIGHLMSNTIGEAIARVFEVSGATVARANYQGDTGVHVAKAIWGKQQKPELSWGEAYVYGSAEYETHKEAIDALNKVVYEKSDVEVEKLYTEGRTESLSHFEKIYALLGTTFAHYFFESEVGPVGKKIVEAHPEVFTQSDGAVVFKGEEYGLHTRVFINSRGIPTYEAKELGLVEAKKAKGDFALSLTVTAKEISEYFKVVRKAAELVFPDIEGKMLTRFHGFLKLTTGKMSSRMGNVITGESLINDLVLVAKEKMVERTLAQKQKVAEQVAVGAIKYSVLKQGSGKDIIFDPEQSLSLEGDSGPYLQYAHTRARSLLRAAAEAGVVAGVGDAPEHLGVLERMLVHFPSVVSRAAEELEPHYITTYLTELASSFNSWYASGKVLGGPHEAYGVLVTEAVAVTLERGLSTLGIPVPSEM